MKLKIYDERYEAKKEVFLKLVHDDESTDAIKVAAVNKEDGEWLSNLLKITPEGIYLNTNVLSSLGFDLDEEGRLKILGAY